MGEVFAEAAKIGAVANGFFYEAETRDDGKTLTVEIPFLQAGVSMVQKTATLLSAILAENIQILSIHCSQTSLEDYYLSLIGGGKQ